MLFEKTAAQGTNKEIHIKLTVHVLESAIASAMTIGLVKQIFS